LAYALLQLGDPHTSKTESEAGLALLEPLAAKNPTQAPYRRLLYLAYQHLGSAQGQPLGVNLNDTAATLQSYAKMLAIAQQFLATDAKDQRARDDVAVSLILIGETEAIHEPARGAATLHRALEELRTLAAAGGDPFRYRMLQAETLTWLADAENRQSNRVAAFNYLREAQAVWQTMFAEQPNDFSVKARDCEVQQILAEVLWAQGDFDGAFAALQRALAFAEAEKAAKPTEAIPLWRLADCYQRFGACYEAQARTQRPEERRAVLQQASDWYQKSLQQWDEWPRLAVSGVFNTTRRVRVAQALARGEAQLKP
jgi:tetratricopeptide (TPR) repeat protein